MTPKRLSNPVLLSTHDGHTSEYYLEPHCRRGGYSGWPNQCLLREDDNIFLRQLEMQLRQETGQSHQSSTMLANRGLLFGNLKAVFTTGLLRMSKL